MSINFGFEPTERSSGFVFVSYAHVDAKEAAWFSLYLHRRGIPVWYDRGLHPLGQFPKEITEKVQASACVVMFISRRFAESGHCMRETGIAVNENKPIFPVFIEKMNALPHDLKYAIGTTQHLEAYEFDPNDTARYIYDMVVSVLRGEKSQWASWSGESDSSVRAECTNLIKDADVWLNKYMQDGDVSALNQARVRYRKAADEYSSDHRGWIGLAKCVCVSPIVDYKSIVGELESLDEYFKFMRHTGCKKDAIAEFFSYKTKYVKLGLRKIEADVMGRSDVGEIDVAIAVLDRMKPLLEDLSEEMRLSVQKLADKLADRYLSLTVNSAVTLGEELKASRNATTDTLQLNVILFKMRAAAKRFQSVAEVAPFFQQLIAETEQYIQQCWVMHINNDLSRLSAQRNVCVDSASMEMVASATRECLNKYMGTDGEAYAKQVLIPFHNESVLSHTLMKEREAMLRAQTLMHRCDSCTTPDEIEAAAKQISAIEMDKMISVNVANAHTMLAGRLELAKRRVAVAMAHQAMDAARKEAEESTTSYGVTRVLNRITLSKAEWTLGDPELEEKYNKLCDDVRSLGKRRKVSESAQNTLDSVLDAGSSAVGAVGRFFGWLGENISEGHHILVILLSVLMLAGIRWGYNDGAVLSWKLMDKISSMTGFSIATGVICAVILAASIIIVRVRDRIYLSEFSTAIVGQVVLAAMNIGMYWLETRAAASEELRVVDNLFGVSAGKAHYLQLVLYIFFTLMLVLYSGFVDLNVSERILRSEPKDKLLLFVMSFPPLSALVFLFTNESALVITAMCIMILVGIIVRFEYRWISHLLCCVMTAAPLVVLFLNREVFEKLLPRTMGALDRIGYRFLYSEFMGNVELTTAILYVLIALTMLGVIIWSVMVNHNKSVIAVIVTWLIMSVLMLSVELVTVDLNYDIANMLFGNDYILRSSMLMIICYMVYALRCTFGTQTKNWTMVVKGAALQVALTSMIASGVDTFGIIRYPADNIVPYVLVGAVFVTELISGIKNYREYVRYGV